MEQWVQLQVSVPSSRVGSFYEMVGRWLQQDTDIGSVGAAGSGGPVAEEPANLLGQRDDGWRTGSGDELLRDARNLYRSLSNGARTVTDYWVDHPGEQIKARELARALGIASTNGIAGRLASFGYQLKKAGHRGYPFLWSKGPDDSVYWMEPDVAELFRQVRQFSG